MRCCTDDLPIADAFALARVPLRAQAFIQDAVEAR